MSLISDWSERLKALVFRRRQEEDLDDELQFHVDREVEERIKAGADPVAARQAATVAFGGMGRMKEEVRGARGIRPLEEFLADVRYSLRGLTASPVFAAAAIIVLGLGLGASTAVFTIADQILLSDLPYPDAGRLVSVRQKNSPTNIWNLSSVDGQAIQAQQKSFDAFGLVRRNDVALSGAGRPEQITAGLVTSGFFQALSVRAAAGRLVLPSDEGQEAPGVAVVSDAMAREKLGGVSAAVGRSITIDGISHQVVGVLPPGVDELASIRAQVWYNLKLLTPTRRGPFWLRGIGRLRAGLTIADATRDLAGISTRIFPIWASSFRDQSAKLTPISLREAIVGTSGRQVGLFGAAVLLVLLIAVANVATLMLVRASAREQELAVRSALGAARSRLARLLVTDSLVLTTLAGLVGVGLAALGLRLTSAFAGGLPRIHEIHLGARALAFAAEATAVSGLLVSTPALLASLSGRGGGSLRLDSRRAGTSRRSNLTRSVLVVAEFALALPLLAGAGLLLQSFVRLQQVDLGFDPKGAVSIAISLPPSRYPDYAATQRFWRLMEQRAAAVPGVTAAGLTMNLPPDAPNDENNFDLIDRPVPSGTAEPTAPWSGITPGYLATLGIPFLEGRRFAEADSEAAPPVVLVSRAWARHYYPKGSAVGKQMVSGGCTTCPPTTVIGVVGDVKYLGVAAGADAVYSPIAQYDARQMNLVVRSTLGDGPAIRALREVVAGLDADLAVVETTLERRLDDSLAGPFQWTAVLGAFAATAMILAALGVFGLMSYGVRQRRREIGIRLALGAAPGSVTGMVVKRGVGYALVGSGIGVGLTLLTGRWLSSFLFGVAAHDPVTVGGVVVLLLTTAGVACWLPGREAARIHPIEAISNE